MNIIVAAALIALSATACAMMRVPRCVILLIGLGLAVFTGLFRFEAAAPMILLLTAVLLILQVVIPLLYDFVAMAFRIPFSRWLAIVGRTTLLASPAVVLAAGSIYKSLYIGDWIAGKTIYQMETLAEWACEEDGTLKIVCDRSQEGLKGDINDAVARAFVNLRRDLKDEVRASVAAGNVGSNDGVRAIESALFDPPNGVIKSSLSNFNPAFRYRAARCRWYHWLTDTRECIRRMFLQPMDAAYKSFRAQFRSEFREQAAAGIAAGDARGQHLIRTTDRFVDTEIDRAEQRLRIANGRIFLMLSLWNLLSITLVALAAIKIFMFIFVRHVYDPYNGAQALNFVDRVHRRMPRLDVRDITREGTSAGSPAFGFSQPLEGQRWDANFSDGMGPDRRGRLGIPRPLTFVLPRIAGGKLFFSSYKGDGARAQFGGYGTHDQRFFRVTLPAGRRVAVRLENLVAFSDDVRTRSIFDVRLPLLLQHSFFLRVIEGPGAIILSARGGNAAVMTVEGAAADPFEIIAYDLDGEFSLDVNQGFFSTYFDNHSLLPASEESMVLRTTAPSLRKSTTHLARKLLFFLLPV
ncbi:hypothetical protein [Sulfitobacter sp. 20_GPM-1509m]|uniref:hypothetical protein n=1 Tax=Sulfitobacter sp. 20_GPM-1509m TaxID=1380367 RepID=UPI00048BF79D|nr:hypothetical protein [Sulfitobacter sp. 20_GPM-1509m]